MKYTQTLVIGLLVIIVCICCLAYYPSKKGPTVPLKTNLEDGRVPKIIHQTAPSDKSKWPAIWLKCQATWKQHFPDFVYIMWNDEDIDYFMSSRFPSYYGMFKEYDKHIKRVDVARYFILYEYGGIYADMDYQCNKNFYHLLPKGKVSIAESPHAGEGFQNALMASPPKNPYWLEVFKDLVEHKDVDDVLQATGPQVIVRNAKSEWFHPLPARQFSPSNEVASVTQRADLQVFNDSDVYASHLGTWTWLE